MAVVAKERRKEKTLSWHRDCSKALAVEWAKVSEKAGSPLNNAI
jgi:hypothetical protein